MSSPEVLPKGNEALETAKASAEQYEKAAEALERSAERSVENAEQATEKAKVEALEQAISVERGSAERVRNAAPSSGPAPKKRSKSSKKELDASFNRRMSTVRAELSAPERAFSKFIHAKPVEKTSEVVGATIARPNAILSGAVVAFVAVLATYLIAKNLGYPLSGFETIGAFIAGWILGILYDFFRVMITGKK